MGVDEDGDDHTDDASVGSETLIARELPRPVGHEMDREEHLHDVLARGEEIVGLIEETVAETGTDEHTDEDVHEERVELLIGDLLILVELRHEQCTKEQAYEPAHGIPPHTEGADVENDF